MTDQFVHLHVHVVVIDSRQLRNILLGLALNSTNKQREIAISAMIDVLETETGD